MFLVSKVLPVRLTTLPPSVSRLSRQYRILNISEVRVSVSWLRHYITSRKVAGSRTDEVIVCVYNSFSTHKTCFFKYTYFYISRLLFIISVYITTAVATTTTTGSIITTTTTTYNYHYHCYYYRYYLLLLLLILLLLVLLMLLLLPLLTTATTIATAAAAYYCCYYLY
jgi:hypothetical protein